MTPKLKKYILILSAIFAFTFVSLAEEKEEYEDVLLNIVEQMPEFPGGIDGLIKFLSENIQHPVEARTKGNIKQGRVLVQFVIDETGKVVDVKIIESVSPALDKEAVRVVESMPNWTPGTQRGKNVRVKFTLPINFRVRGE